MNNYIGFYDLKTIQVSPGVEAWAVECRRCGLAAQTSSVGPYKCAPDLTMLINRHICDPDKRAKINGV